MMFNQYDPEIGVGIRKNLFSLVPAEVDTQQVVEANIVWLEVLHQVFAQPRIHPGRIGIMAIVFVFALVQLWLHLW